MIATVDNGRLRKDDIGEDEDNTDVFVYGIIHNSGVRKRDFGRMRCGRVRVRNNKQLQTTI